MDVVLDAWAAIALIEKEPAGKEVVSWLSRSRARMSWVNVGEVFYALIRRYDEPSARRLVDELVERSNAEAADAQVCLAAARFKARGGLSYADAFVLATAQKYGAPLLTGDDELIGFDAGQDIAVVDLRAART